MTIVSLIGSFAVIAFLLTLITREDRKNPLITFLQYFVGVWFVFSGVVKAIDPIGTAVKMQQYFSEFEKTLNGTALKSISGVFPLLAENVLTFSVTMIVLEIVLGVLIIIGHWRKPTLWVFLILNVFFLILTGYTHLSGYVPSNVNFFDFSKWGEFNKTNMRVTDCGCFGDFLKLVPTISFKKDLYLLVPISFLLLFFSKQNHQLFTVFWRRVIFIGTLVGTYLFCNYNINTSEPVVDFRPFKNGVNIAERKKQEEAAAGKVEITNYILKNQKTGETKKMSYKEYITDKGYTNFGESSGWKVMDEERTEPTTPTTKISDFSIADKKGDDVTEKILTDPNYSFLVVSSKIKSKATDVITEVIDSVFRMDTIKLRIGKRDTLSVIKKFERLGKREQTIKAYSFDADYIADFQAKINPFLADAEKEGYKIAGVVPFADQKLVEALSHAIQASFPIYNADEVLCETMIRSNPGVFLLHNGTIVHKWHKNALPKFFEVKKEFIK